MAWRKGLYMDKWSMATRRCILQISDARLSRLLTLILLAARQHQDRDLLLAPVRPSAALGRLNSHARLVRS